MSKSVKGLAENETINSLQFTSATELFREWNNSINNFLLIEDQVNGLSGSAGINSMLSQTGNLFENIQRLIMDEMIERTGARDKEQFIRILQVMVTRLLDSISQAATTEHQLYQKEPVGTLVEILIRVLQFLKEYFGSYFDKNEKIPFALMGVYLKEINRLGNKLSISVSQQKNVNPKLIELLITHFENGNWMNKQDCSYNHFLYVKELVQILLTENTLTDLSIRQLLYYFNFNCSSFVIYEFDRLVEIISQFPTKSEKISALRTELKIINQLPSRVNYSFDEDMPSLKEQVSTWIEEEIRYCEAGHFIQMPVNANGEVENKIHTTLSVAKLSLLIRLLVVDKIIINRTIAPMLKTVSKTFSTLQREEISFGSLETKYHAPDKATIAVMKEMLQKWIIILGKL